jgi:hypothetical protein
MKQIVFIILLIFPMVLSAQDTIVKKDGIVIPCKIEKEDSSKVFISYKQNGQYFNSIIDKTDISYFTYGVVKKKTSSSPENITLGIGLGLDFGGIGGNITIYPQRNIGLFAGIGYAYAGLGYNFGAKLRYIKKDKLKTITPYLLGMYGYNAAINVENAESLNKLFYGPSFGIGMDCRLDPRDNIYASLALLIPVRDSEVNEYIEYLEDEQGALMKNKLYPVGISLGMIFILNRPKRK